LLALMAASLWPAQAHAQAFPSESIVVRAYDTFGVSIGSIEKAQSTVNAILEGAGINADWRNCRTPNPPMSKSKDVCAEVLRTRELVVRIVAAPRTVRDREALGYSHVDPQLRRGTLATVFADRIRAFAGELHLQEGQLLGRAIAHELGHLMLGSLDHSDVGLMRGYWSTRGHAADWIFSPVEGARMRSAVAARGDTDPTPLAHARSQGSYESRGKPDASPF
jgi:hypothetical protein